MARKTHADKRVEAAYYAVGHGIQIDIMDINKVYRVGLTAVANGADDETLKATIAAYLDTIRKN